MRKFFAAVLLLAVGCSRSAQPLDFSEGELADDASRGLGITVPQLIAKFSSDGDGAFRFDAKTDDGSTFRFYGESAKDPCFFMINAKDGTNVDQIELMVQFAEIRGSNAMQNAAKTIFNTCFLVLKDRDETTRLMKAFVEAFTADACASIDLRSGRTVISATRNQGSEFLFLTIRNF